MPTCWQMQTHLACKQLILLAFSTSEGGKRAKEEIAPRTDFWNYRIDMDDVLIINVEDVASSKKRVRKLQHIWTSEQTERLIEAVELRPGTWDYLTKEYRDRNLREALWQEVASELELTRSEVTTKWNSLRCSFRVCISSTCLYIYFSYFSIYSNLGGV